MAGTRTAPLLAVALLALVAVPAAAQDLEGCDDFQRYVERENYPRALEELNWCKRSVEDLHYEKIKEIVDRSVNGYAPGDITVEGALGVATVEARYRPSDGSADEIRLQITSSAAAGSAAGAGLSALTGLANAFGVRQAGSDQVRVAGLTGQMKEEGDGWNLMLSMDGGIVINLFGAIRDALEAFAEDLIPDLEDYLG